MDKHFNSQERESYWYSFWLKEKVFEKASEKESNKSYCIMLPPPNVTGSLHMGHAFQDTLMDMLIRYHMIQGQKVLWQVGTDHAGIATQMVVDRLIESEGIDLKTLSREERVARIWQWKEHSGGAILSQLKRLGTAIDWRKERFTLDEDYHDAVQKAFIQLYREGLITKKKRLVNWDCHLQSAVSDLEVDHIETNGFIYTIRYKIKDSNDFLSIATTRPETLFGDVAVAVHPDDLRYQHLIGKTLVLPIIGREIPVVADVRVAQDFGTGCVKITPAHDFFDFEVATSAQLPFINILHPNGLLNEECGPFAGQDRLQAREAILDRLKQEGLFVEATPHLSNLPVCSRSQQRIEPYLTEQWYVTMKPLADRALQAYHNKEFIFAPSHWGSNYEQWLTHIQDWCISRQLIWGHRIPAWTDSNGHVYVGENEENVRQYYNLSEDIVLQQDPDVLDTWFSSALWPFATLGWPKKDFDSTSFFPNSALVSGFDIIFFWVARMIMFSLHFLKQVPFKHVYLHGIIQDAHGQKMSKSKGNVIDPIDLIDGIALPDLLKKRTTGLMQPSMRQMIAEQTQKDFPNGIASYGADALRMTFAQQATPGRFIRFDFHRLETQQQTCHKLWNLVRYVLPHLSSKKEALTVHHPFNQWILGRLFDIQQETSELLKEYRFDFFVQKLVEFMWADVCDQYIELSKTLLKQSEWIEETQYTLTLLVQGLLLQLHPIIPFITEELNFLVDEKIAPQSSYVSLLECSQEKYQSIFQKRELTVSHDQIQHFFFLLKSIRTLRSKMDIPPKAILPIHMESDPELFEKFAIFYEHLAKVSDHAQHKVNQEEVVKFIRCVDHHVTYSLGLPMSYAEERLNRLQIDLKKLEEEYHVLHARLSNPGFRERAPAAVIAKDSLRCEELFSQITVLKDSIAQIS